MQEAEEWDRDPGGMPYLLPMLSFLLFLLPEAIGLSVPDPIAPLLPVLRVAVPLGFLVYFALRGAYPELSGYRPSLLWLADVGIGLIGAALWILPFLCWDSLRPADPGFDPKQLGAEGVGLALCLRAVGYAGVTPFVEELFVRSWLLRSVDVFAEGGDFREVPIGRFHWLSFGTVTLFFVFSHSPWEYGVMLGWTLLTMAWFYYRKHLAPLVTVHAVTNGAIFAFVLAFDERFRDAAGRPLPLWFFL